MKKALLFIIVILAFVLRVYHVNQIPPSLSWDEVSIGYNAYSVLMTGRDEHGRFLPIDTFAAYGDYKPPIPIYLTVPFVAAFGLNELAVRLPAVLFGTLTVFLTYFLVKELFLKLAISYQLSAISSLLLAISPWHINLSRAGFEATIALFFVVAGVYVVLKARERASLWIVAWIPFVAAMYTFNSARYFSVVFAVGLLIFCFREVKKHKRQFVLGVLLGLLTLAPLVPHLISKEARLRFAEVNIFTDASTVETANARIEREGGTIVSKLINNRRVGYARSYLLHFFDNLQPRFLFVQGDGNPKFSIQDVGQLYLIEAPFFAIGIVMLFVSQPAIAGLLMYWIIAAIIPAAVARETPHALRTLNSLPTWQIFVAFGIISVARYVTRVSRRWQVAYYVLLVILYAFSFTYYLHNYYRHYPTEFSAEWQYGYREAFAAITPIVSKYDRVVVTNSIGRPYMYALFYTKTDPNELLRTKDSTFDVAGFYHVYGFTKYRFGGLLPDTLGDRMLFIWDAGVVPKGARVIDTIRLLNGNPVLTIFDNGSIQL